MGGGERQGGLWVSEGQNTMLQSYSATDCHFQEDFGDWAEGGEGNEVRPHWGTLNLLGLTEKKALWAESPPVLRRIPLTRLKGRRAGTQPCLLPKPTRGPLSAPPQPWAQSLQEGVGGRPTDPQLEGGAAWRRTSTLPGLLPRAGSTF